MSIQTQIENDSEVEIGGLRLHNATGTAIRVTYDNERTVLDIVACCIGEGAGMKHDP